MQRTGQRHIQGGKEPNERLSRPQARRDRSPVAVDVTDVGRRHLGDGRRRAGRSERERLARLASVGLDLVGDGQILHLGPDLLAPEIGKDAALRDEIRVSALLDNPALAEDEDDVGLDDRRQPMGDSQGLAGRRELAVRADAPFGPC